MLEMLKRFTVLSFLVAWPVVGEALQPEQLAENWRWRRFDREEGLQGSIFAIGRDRDDFIYAGTNRGLLRYNGFVWTPLQSNEPFDAGPIVKIVESGGNLYAATRSEVWIARYGLELHRLLAGGRLILAAGPLGGVYAVDMDTRIHYHLEKEVKSQIDEGLPLPEDEIFDYVVDDRRIHWLATREGPYRRDIRSRFRWQLDPELGSDLRGHPCIRLFLVKRQTVTRTPYSAPVPPGLLSFELWGLFERMQNSQNEADGRYILAKRGESGWAITTIDSSRPAIADLVLDGRGSYIAASEEGKVYISEDGKDWVPAPVLGIGSVVLSGGLVDQHGYLWFRAGNSAIGRFDGLSRRWQRYWKGLGLPSNNILSLLESSDGRVWAGTENGVFCYLPELPNEPIAYRMVGTTPLKSVTGIAEDRTGKIWISSSEAFKGTFFFEEGTWHRFESGERRTGSLPAVTDHQIRRIVTDRNGDLWFLSAWEPRRGRQGPSSDSERDPNYLIYRYSASIYTVSNFRAVELPYGPASDVLVSQDKAFWIGTDEGLLRTTSAEKELRRYTEEQGLRSSRIWAIAESADGSIWVCYDPSAASGVTRIRGEEVKTFDERDALASPNARSIASSISPEGSSTWFGTDRGIIRFDGDCWYNYPIPSLDRQPIGVWPLAITGMHSPGDAFEEDSILVGTVGHGIFRFRLDDRRRPRITRIEVSRTLENVMTFRWDGRDFKNETPPDELQFRIQVDNQPWTPFGPEREMTMANLEPGEHTFFVEMRDRDGNSNREQYFRTFLIPKLSATFLSPVLLAVLGGAGGALALAALVVGFLWRSLRRASSAGSPVDAGFIFASFPGAVLVLDVEGKIRKLTGSRPDVLGLSPPPADELRGCSAEILPLFQSEPAKSALRRLLGGENILLNAVPIGTGGHFADVIGFPLRFTRGRGKERPVAAILAEDVTSERSSRDLRERSQRLAALQDLSSRISGELTAEENPHTLRLLEDLRRFARPEESTGSREPLVLGEMVESLLGKLAVRDDGIPPIEIPPGVEVNLSSQTELWSVPGDCEEMRRALKEILRNAADSMPDGGLLTVRLRNRRIESDPGDLAGGAYVEVEVQDSGPGISPTELRKIFDPFFSTKPRDRARGVGLSMAYGIIRRHRGDIRIVSTPGAGTIATIYLPADPRL